VTFQLENVHLHLVLQNHGKRREYVVLCVKLYHRGVHFDLDLVDVVALIRHGDGVVVLLIFDLLHCGIVIVP
jgi:hypothetical protein